MWLDIAALLALTCFAAIALRTARVLTRVEGVFLLLGYIVFLLALILSPHTPST